MLKEDPQKRKQPDETSRMLPPSKIASLQHEKAEAAKYMQDKLTEQGFVSANLTAPEIESLRQDKQNSIVAGQEYLKKIKKKAV